MRRGRHHQPLRIMLLVLLVGCHQLVTRTTGVGAFITCVPVVVRQQQQQPPLQAAVDDNDDGNKKRRKRKRKNPGASGTTTTTTMKQANGPMTAAAKKSVPLQETRTASKVIEEAELEFDQDRDNEDNPVDIDLLNDIASYKFDPNQFDATAGPPQADKATATTTPGATTTPANRGASLTLPDIKEARKLKQLEEELANKAEEEASNKVRIKRSDKEAFRKLLEQQPFADADDSLFVEEEYGTVSALLGERAKPFLGIPLGPLQVGHFIGSLGIVLMAFVEYPGFPLTNLPTPLRLSLQGGLATVYFINAVLAGLVAFKAPERGQPLGLWIPKTFAVGGLAYDQLMQLPTLDEIEKAKAVKGRRAIKNKKK